MKRFRTPRGAFFLFLAVGCVFLAYYILNLRIEKSKPEDYVKLTKVQEVLSRDLEKNYPPTPKEVVKYYSEITKCFYNEDYTEEELEALAMKAVELYDRDLAANKDTETYLMDLKEDIKDFKDKDWSISSFSTSSSTDVDTFSDDGYDFARLYCTYNIRNGTVIQKLEERFLLRLDDKGHWKIYGWDSAKEEEEK